MEYDQSRIHHLIHGYVYGWYESERGQFENPDVNESQISTY